MRRRCRCFFLSHFISNSLLRLVSCWLFNVPATRECISGMDLLRQFYVLPHWGTSCRSNFPSQPVTVYWHRADQSHHWPYNARRLVCQFLSHWHGSTPEKSRRKRDSNPGSSALEADALTTRPTRRFGSHLSVVCLFVGCLLNVPATG